MIMESRIIANDPIGDDPELLLNQMFQEQLEPTMVHKSFSEDDDDDENEVVTEAHQKVEQFVRDPKLAQFGRENKLELAAKAVFSASTVLDGGQRAIWSAWMVEQMRKSLDYVDKACQIGLTPPDTFLGGESAEASAHLRRNEEQAHLHRNDGRIDVEEQLMQTLHQANLLAVHCLRCQRDLWPDIDPRDVWPSEDYIIKKIEEAQQSCKQRAVRLQGIRNQTGMSHSWTHCASRRTAQSAVHLKTSEWPALDGTSVPSESQTCKLSCTKANLILDHSEPQK